MACKLLHNRSKVLKHGYSKTRGINQEERVLKSRESRPRYSLRMLTIGLASVMFGSVIFAVSANGVSADTIENGATTNQPTTITEADQTKTTTSTETSEKAKAPEATDKATAEKAYKIATKQNDQKTESTTDQQHDEINWNAVEYTHDNNGVKITGWNIKQGGYHVLLPNTSDFVIHSDITDFQIAEIYEEDMHNIMYALSDKKTLPDGQTFTITISHNNDAHLANNKLHATSKFHDVDDLRYFQYAFSTEDLTTDNKDKYTNNWLGPILKIWICPQSAIWLEFSKVQANYLI